MNTLRDYYVYTISAADGVTRYVGKGRRGRAFFHECKARALLVDPTILRASRVHRRMAAELARGRELTLRFEAEGLTQEQAYEKEAELIALHRRIGEGGTLWNYLIGSPGFRGILHADWLEVSARAVATKGKDGARAAGRKAAATKGPEGHRLAAMKAAATRRKPPLDPTLAPGNPNRFVAAEDQVEPLFPAGTYAAAHPRDATSASPRKSLTRRDVSR